MQATIDFETFTVTDEYGDVWDIVVSDTDGSAIVERDGGDNDRWHAAEYAPHGELYEKGEDSTYGVSCQDEYITVKVDGAGSIRWMENDDE